MMLDAVSALGVRSLPVGPAGGVARPAAPVQAPAAVDAGGDFASLLGNAITDFSNKLRQAEAVSIGGVKGTASMQDVVEHVMSAEQSLQAVIAVRDKVISAYQEISRMAI
jgi:flagellar hook-basal body complex protein FliE